MILQRKNVVRRTDNEGKIAELKALGYREKLTASIAAAGVVGDMSQADACPLDLMKLKKAELVAMADGVRGASHMTKAELVAVIEGAQAK